MVRISPLILTSFKATPMARIAASLVSPFAKRWPNCTKVEQLILDQHTKASGPAFKIPVSLNLVKYKHDLGKRSPARLAFQITYSQKMLGKSYIH